MNIITFINNRFLNCNNQNFFLKFVDFCQRRGSRMTIGDVRSQLSEIMNVSALRQEDVVEGLRILEADGVIQLNERAQTIFVRAGVVA